MRLQLQQLDFPSNRHVLPENLDVGRPCSSRLFLGTRCIVLIQISEHIEVLVVLPGDLVVEFTSFELPQTWRCSCGIAESSTTMHRLRGAD